MLAEAKQALAAGLKPTARLVGYAHAGVDPSYMGMGPVPATRKVLERTGLKVADLDVVESNEAFAAQACAVIRELDLDPAKVNPNGSGISLGHPVGANWRDTCCEGDPRTASYRRPPRTGNYVHWRRAGYRRNFRTGVNRRRVAQERKGHEQ